jgi:hypothetical protein
MYKELTIPEQIALQKYVETLHAILIAAVMVFFVVGVILGSISNHVTVDSACKWFHSQDKTAQIDFMIANLDAEQKRAIAVHFCSLNPNARSICAHAKLISPVRSK